MHKVTNETTLPATAMIATNANLTSWKRNARAKKQAEEVYKEGKKSHDAIFLQKQSWKREVRTVESLNATKYQYKTTSLPCKCYEVVLLTYQGQELLFADPLMLAAQAV